MPSDWWKLSWHNDNHLKLRIHKLNKLMTVCKAKKKKKKCCEEARDFNTKMYTSSCGKQGFSGSF